MQRLLYPDKTGLLNSSWTIQMPDGVPLPSNSIEVIIEGDDHLIQGVDLVIRGPHLLWKNIAECRLFDYSAERAGAILGGPFDDNKEFIVRVRMKSDPLTVISLTSFSLGDIINNLQSDMFNSNLSTQYTLLSVTQQRGPIELGFQMQ